MIGDVHIRRPTRSDPEFVVFRADEKRVLIVRRKSAAGADAAAREFSRAQGSVRMRCLERWFKPCTD